MQDQGKKRTTVVVASIALLVAVSMGFASFGVPEGGCGGPPPSATESAEAETVQAATAAPGACDPCTQVRVGDRCVPSGMVRCTPSGACARELAECNCAGRCALCTEDCVNVGPGRTDYGCRTNPTRQACPGTGECIPATATCGACAQENNGAGCDSCTQYCDYRSNTCKTAARKKCKDGNCISKTAVCAEENPECGRCGPCVEQCRVAPNGRVTCEPVSPARILCSDGKTCVGLDDTCPPSSPSPAPADAGGATTTPVAPVESER